MIASRNPAKSRPLSDNVKRLMWLARAAPVNPRLIAEARDITDHDLDCCKMQGELFMEAMSMGLSMEAFAPNYMTSKLASLIDVSFACTEEDVDEVIKNLHIPFLFKEPSCLVEALYWIDDIVSRSQEENKSLALTKALSEMDKPALPAALAVLPSEPIRDISKLSYAYWLGYVYRYECVLHEESSRMVYGAFDEKTMREAYASLIRSPLGEVDLKDSVAEICRRLDKHLVENIWGNKPWGKPIHTDQAAYVLS
ncbi:MAG: hypothetical protein IKR28_01585 [Selenomonadaceae bacterium]|nr:hypothetical protein [Selenomonadaceae bacterium]